MTSVAQMMDGYSRFKVSSDHIVIFEIKKEVSRRKRDGGQRKKRRETTRMCSAPCVHASVFFTVVAKSIS